MASDVPPEDGHTPDLEPKSPPLAETQRHGIGLCLSGGGYRAALFHLGVLRRLNELGILSRPDFRTVSSVSGGSITAAHVATVLEWPLQRPLPAQEWERQVSRPFRRFTATNIRTGAVAKGFAASLLPWNLLNGVARTPGWNRLLPWNWFLNGSTAVEVLANRYKKDLTGIRLKDLPKQPTFAFCATDMAFGANWVFERERMGDYVVGYRQPPEDWLLARAVAASACFPPIFNPMPVAYEPSAYVGGILPAGHAKRLEAFKDLRLTDGGNYDNMGIEPIWSEDTQTHDVILVSNAGGLFDYAADRQILWRIMRYTTIVENQARALRQRWLIASFRNRRERRADWEMEGAYWGIGAATTSYDRDNRTGYSKALAREMIAEIRTDLDAFSVAEAAVLENHGYLLTDAAVRKWVPRLLPTPAVPLNIPHEEWMPRDGNEERIWKALDGSSKRKKLGRW